MLSLLGVALAAGDDAVEAWAAAVAPDVVPATPEPEGGFRFLGTFTAKGTATDITTTNPLLNGQVVGELGGTNTTAVGEAVALGTEQRAVGILSWTPPVLSGAATLTAGFEVDFAWGDQSYSIGGNTGGAYGADQVNLQTRRLHGRFRLWEAAHATVGLQFVADGAVDPEMVGLDHLVRSGGRLLFFGSEAAGVSVFGKAFGQVDYRLGGYTLYESAAAEPDDVTLWMADTRWHPAYAVTVGLHGWYLRDRSSGTAGLLGTGPTSALSEMQGGPHLDVRGDAEAAPEVAASLGWIVADAGYNLGLDRGDVGVTGTVALTPGRLYVKSLEDVSMFGVLADVEARWRYAPGAGSIARVEVLYTSGDGEAPGYGGVITGNSFGVAGAAHVTHGCLLLFPDILSINRQVALVYDVSNAGAGLVAATATFGWDPIPDRLTVAAGGGVASNAFQVMEGAEANLRVVARPLPLLSVGGYGAVLFGSGFTSLPWTAYAAVDWVVF